MSKLKLRIGDVFSVPLDDTRIGLGQIVATFRKGVYYFALFSPAYARDAPIDLAQAVQEPLALLGLSFDAKIYVGDWVVLGNQPVAEGMPLPAYKEGGPGWDHVVDYSGTRRRPAQGQEGEWLPFRTFVAPVRLEKALKAKHGLEPWHEAYAELEPSQLATTARLFD